MVFDSFANTEWNWSTINVEFYQLLLRSVFCDFSVWLYTIYENMNWFQFHQAIPKLKLSSDYNACAIGQITTVMTEFISVALTHLRT